LTPASLPELQRKAAGEVDDCVVGALIADAGGRLFAQKRAPDRRLFPGCWDIVGGHVEAGETLAQALVREVAEETGWQVRAMKLFAIYDWSVVMDGRKVTKREFDFFVEVEGNLGAPRLEMGKHTECRWFGPDDLEILMENREVDDTFMCDLIGRALGRAGFNL
jgi:8-oxo-dGTP pyrophosphatase MutT (NUDIX family)